MDDDDNVCEHAEEAAEHLEERKGHRIHHVFAFVELVGLLLEEAKHALTVDDLIDYLQVKDEGTHDSRRLHDGATNENAAEEGKLTA